MKLKWCVLRNKDNYLIVNKWFNNNVFKPKSAIEGLTEDSPIYLHYPAYKGAYLISERIPGWITLHPEKKYEKSN